jgi:hypothetical protein
LLTELLRLVKLLSELNKLGAVLVAAAGNDFEQTAHDGKSFFDAYPAKFFQEGLDDLIIVGASDNVGRAGLFSQWGNEVSVWAPGSGVYFPDYAGGSQYITGSGSSFGKPPLFTLLQTFWRLGAVGISHETTND